MGLTNYQWVDVPIGNRVPTPHPKKKGCLIQVRHDPTGTIFTP